MNKRECEDCRDEMTKRRTRCKRCGKLVCTWCLHHVHISVKDETGAYMRVLEKMVDG